MPALTSLGRDQILSISLSVRSVCKIKLKGSICGSNYQIWPHTESESRSPIDTARGQEGNPKQKHTNVPLVKLPTSIHPKHTEYWTWTDKWLTTIIPCSRVCLSICSSIIGRHWRIGLPASAINSLNYLIDWCHTECVHYNNKNNIIPRGTSSPVNLLIDGQSLCSAGVQLKPQTNSLFTPLPTLWTILFRRKSTAQNHWQNLTESTDRSNS